MQTSSVLCVMVTFNPDLDELLISIESIVQNNVSLVVVDNGSTNQQELLERSSKDLRFEVIALNNNEGIAAAQNKGITQGIENGAEYIWLSDQDTKYPADFIQRMLDSVESLTVEQRADLAAISPSFYDHTQSMINPVFRFAPYTKANKPKPGLNVSTHVIASGMLIPVDVLKQIGLKREDLFIDWVDTEWCWRAIYQYKKKVWMVGDVQIDHELGDEYQTFMGKKFTLRSSFRHYFMVRNAIALALYFKSLPIIPRLEILFKSMVRVILFPIIVKKNKKQHMAALWLGFVHGVLNRLGPKR